MREFRYLLREESLVLGDTVVDNVDYIDVWFAPLLSVEDGSLASFRSAVKWSKRNYPSTDEAMPDELGFMPIIGRLMVTSEPPEEFDHDYSMPDMTQVLVHFDGTVGVEFRGLAKNFSMEEDQIKDLIAPLVERAGAQVIGVAFEGPEYVARLLFERRGATVRDAVELGNDAAALIDSVREDGLTARSAFDLLTAGHVNLLIGLEESTWLEAKSQGYDLEGDAGRIELAQDVARFANGEHDGLLVIGLRTRKKAGVEVISKVVPALTAFDVSRYHKTIDARIFPPPEGMVLRDIPTRLDDGREGHVLAIYLPGQPEELKPFLVHGAVVNGKVEGAFISIVRRRGEHSIPVTAASIHATLAAGRALLRRGELPGDR